MRRYLSDVAQQEPCLRLFGLDNRDRDFLPDLATSINEMSDVLAAMQRHCEAAKSAEEALLTFQPFVERYQETYGGLARTIGLDVLKYSENASTEPNGVLLQRVTRALGGDAAEEPAADDPADAALKVRIGAIIATAQQTGSLDEKRLAELPAEIAQKLRAA